jgi:hypothetical protein
MADTEAKEERSVSAFQTNTCISKHGFERPPGTSHSESYSASHSDIGKVYRAYERSDSCIPNCSHRYSNDHSNISHSIKHFIKHTLKLVLNHPA